jgi:hypothetical protein
MGVPPPRVFWPKSVEETGKKGVAFWVSAKKRKRVRKSVKTKVPLRTLERLRESVPFWEEAVWWDPHPPVFCKCCF